MGARWFADIDEDVGTGWSHWAAYVQVPGAVHQLAGVWFDSREECEQFIREELT